MILVIDNYDSFVHNLARYLQQLGHATHVVRNDQMTAAAVREIQPAAVVLSPGPCTPQQAGCSLDVVRQLAGHLPILGVCLGHQAIAQALGGRVVRAPIPVHGRSSLVTHDGRGAFAGLPNPLRVGRYHSLIVDPQTLPDSLEVCAATEDGLIMAIRHRRHAVLGLQFHPESVLTEYGYAVLAGFLRWCGLPAPDELPAGCGRWVDPARQNDRDTSVPSLMGVTF